MKFSIIINCFNSENFIEKTILSVINQSYENWELIVLDNCSNDKTVEKIRSFNDNRIYFYSTIENVSLAAARNVALKYAKGDFICFLDSDDYYLPDRLEKIFQNLNNTDFIFSNFYTLENDNLVKSKSIKNHEDITKNSLIFNYVINLQTVAFRKSVQTKNKIFFNESLNVIEEYDFFIRFLCYTNRISYIPDPLVVYRIHQNSLSIKLIDSIPIEMKLVTDMWRSINIINNKQYNKLSKKIDYFIIKKHLFYNNRRKAILYSLNKLNVLLFIISIIGYKYYKKIYFLFFKRILIP